MFQRQYRHTNPGEYEFNGDGPVIAWLLDGDPAVRWQTMKDLLREQQDVVNEERRKVATEGWGKALLDRQDPEGTWVGKLYSPKWTSTTYTMLLLRRLGLSPDNPEARTACGILLNNGFYRDGGINYSKSYRYSETCITGIVLSILAYFEFSDERVHQLAEHLYAQQLPDGGWNCRSYQGDTHSSFHTTINVLEGLREYEKYPAIEKTELHNRRDRAVEFLHRHRLFRSHRTGEIVDNRMTCFSFPPRWRYDIMRCLDLFGEWDIPYEPGMDDALGLIRDKRGGDGTWPLQNRQPGRTFFELEQPGKPSRWNTLRALRILRKYV